MQQYSQVTSEKERWLLCKSHNVGCPDETLDKGEPAVDITLSEIEQSIISELP